jgi:hypothetical protein
MVSIPTLHNALSVVAAQIVWPQCKRLLDLHGLDWFLAEIERYRGAA